jgi:RNA polymerase sigma factor (sigma-70 family)
MNEVDTSENTHDEGMAEMITRAQHGDRTSMEQLAELAEARLLTYIYRLTLNYDLTEELCQQTLVKMVQSLQNLEKVDRFWCWLLRHAMGEVQHYYREQKRKHQAEIEALNTEYFQQYVERNHQDGLDQAAHIELTDIIYDAIAQMRLAYRNVLVLRCYENLSFAEIADFMDCKELRARMLFFRAKHALKQTLSRRGFKRDQLMMGLSLFGALTLPARATSTASSVSAASLHIGFLGTLAGSLGTHLGLTLTALTTALIATFTSEHVVRNLIIVGVVMVGLSIAYVYQVLLEG